MSTWRFVSGTNQAHFLDMLEFAGIPYVTEGDTVTVDDPPEDIVVLASTLDAEDEPPQDATWAINFETSSGLQDSGFQDTAAAGGARSHVDPHKPDYSTQVASNQDKTIADGQAASPVVEPLLGLVPHGTKKTERRKTWSQP